MFLDEIEVGCFRFWRDSKHFLRYGDDWNFIIQGSFVFTFGFETRQRGGCLVPYSAQWTMSNSSPDSLSFHRLSLPLASAIVGIYRSAS